MDKLFPKSGKIGAMEKTGKFRYKMPYAKLLFRGKDKFSPKMWKKITEAMELVKEYQVARFESKV